MGDRTTNESLIQTFVNDSFVKSIRQKESYEEIKRDVALKEKELLELKGIRDSHLNRDFITDEKLLDLKQRIVTDMPVHREDLKKLVMEFESFRSCVKTFSELFSLCKPGLPRCPNCCYVFRRCPGCSHRVDDMIGFISQSDEKSFFEKRD